MILFTYICDLCGRKESSEQKPVDWTSATMWISGKETEHAKYFHICDKCYQPLDRNHDTDEKLPEPSVKSASLKNTFKSIWKKTHE